MADSAEPMAASGAAPAAASAAVAAAPAPAPAQPSPLEARSYPGCLGESRRVLERDPAGRVVRRVRTGSYQGTPLRVEEWFGPDGRLVRARVEAMGRKVDAGPGLMEPFPGLTLAATAQEADAAPPRCAP
jgi:hypothetical protein